MNISKISIYPVKSLGAIDLESTLVTPRGLRFDRRFMVVDSSGMFLTQRDYPQFALLEVIPDALSVVIKSDSGSTCEWRLEGVSEAERRKVTVWKSIVDAVYAPESVNEWLTEFLGNEVSLVYMPEDSLRPTDALHNRGGDIVSFADGYPVLLANEASLGKLNERFEMPFPMERFRPNLVVSGAAPFAEDRWRRIRIGQVLFRITKPCARCVVTTVNQKTGEKEGTEPLKSLAKFRRAVDVYPDRYEHLGLNPSDVLFGSNLVADPAEGSISVGDSVEVLE